MLEIFSFFIWSIRISDYTKNNIKALCRQNFEEPKDLPNTFWHHEPNPAYQKYEGIINSKGTKGEDFLIPKSKSELRIICIGDSTTEGIGVSPNETFPVFLEEKLGAVIKEISGYKTVKVINAGIRSHNSAFNLSYLAFRLIHYQPDIVIIKTSYNDYLPYCIPGMRFDYTNAFPRPYHFESCRNPFWLIARYSFF
ncbi:MAG: hypothetical protein WC419_07015, partial [Candidatus Omnitrophota bacterium]